MTVVQKLIEGMLTGSPVDFLPSKRASRTPSNGARWSASRHIRAKDILRAIDDFPSDQRAFALDIRHARIIDELALDRRTVKMPIIFDTCSFERPVRISRSSLTDISWFGCELPEVGIYGSIFDGDVRLSTCDVDGEFGIVASQVHGSIFMLSSILATSGSDAITLNGTEVSDRVILRRTHTTGSLTGINLRLGGQLIIDECSFFGENRPSITLDDAEIRATTTISRLTAIGEVRAVRAKFEAQLAITDSKLSCATSESLDLQSTVINGSFIVENLSAEGLVRFDHMRVDGGSEILECTFSNAGKIALSMSQFFCSRHFYMEKSQFTGKFGATSLHSQGDFTLSKIELDSSTIASISLADASLDADLLVLNCTLSSSLIATNLRVLGQVSVAESSFGTDRTRSIALQGADLQRGMVIGPVQVTDKIDLARTNIQGALAFDRSIVDFEPTKKITVSLTGANIEWLIGPDSASSALLVAADRLNIGRLDVPQLEKFTLRSAIGWNVKSVHGELLKGNRAAVRLLAGLEQDGRTFAAQPWYELARALEAAGADGPARFIKYQASRRAARNSPWFKRYTLHLLHGVTVGFGYYPLRTMAWLLLILVTTFILVAFNASAFSPTDLRVVGFLDSAGPILTTSSSVKSAAIEAQQLVASYPQFSPILYAIDTAIPPASTGQAASWRIVGNDSLVILLATLKAFSWVFAALLLAGVTGLLRRG